MSDSDYDAQAVVSDGADGVRDEGVVDYTRAVVFGGGATALAITLVEILIGIPQTLLAPVQAFASGFATFIGGTFLAPTRVTDAGATASATSFLEGTGALLGPFAFPVAMGVSLAGMFLFLMFLRRISVSPTQLIRERRS